MDVARLVRCVDADEAAEGAGEEPVFVFRDQPESHLNGERAEQGKDAECPQRRVSDPVPAPAQISEYGARPPHEAREACRRAADEPPHESKDQQRQDRSARPDGPVGVVVVDRPPAEGDEAGEQPMDQPHRQVPDALLHGRPCAQWCMSVRYLSWHALQVPPSSAKRALIAATSLPEAAALKRGAAIWKL